MKSRLFFYLSPVHSHWPLVDLPSSAVVLLGHVEHEFPDVSSRTTNFTAHEIYANGGAYSWHL